jgi:hypothetical protein
MLDKCESRKSNTGFQKKQGNLKPTKRAKRADLSKKEAK